MKRTAATKTRLVLHDGPAVDVPRLTRDPRTLVRAEEHDGVGDVIAGAGPAERHDLADEVVPRVAAPDVVHPVIRTHPISGRKSLYVNEGFPVAIEGLPEAESSALLAELFRHATRPEFIYRHRWRAGDLLMWDNCSTQHKAVADYALPLRRLMHRTTVRGSVPV